MARIALFTGALRTPMGLIISLATNCPYTHAAVEVDGIWYHSSEKQGGFSELNPADYDNRSATIYEFTGDLQPWLKSMHGKQYGWKGIFGWACYAIGIHRGTIKGHRKHFYCYITALQAILNAYVQDNFSVKKTNSNLPHNRKVQRGINKKIGHLYYLCSTDQLHPISGCDLSALFPSGKTGLFGAIR